MSIYFHFCVQKTDTSLMRTAPPARITTSQLKLHLTVSDIQACCSGGKLIIEC